MTFDWKADVVFVNGNVITVDRSFSMAQAVAVKNDKIMAVGSNEEIKSLSGKTTRTFNLKGKTLLPGINDSHIHASLLGSSLPPVAIDLSSAQSAADIVKSVEAKVKIMKPGEWVRGVGLDNSYLSSRKGRPSRYPTRQDLDPISPDNPVYLGVTPFHGERLVLLNSRALALTSINRDTTVQGGEIVKDSLTGEPTGFLIGAPAEALVKDSVPLLNRDQKKQAILAAMKYLNSLGITSITEPGLGPGGRGLFSGVWGTDSIHIYNDLLNQGELTLRASILLLFTAYGSFQPQEMLAGLSSTGTHTGFGNDYLRIAGIKLYADGVPPNRTAWISEEYPGGGHGQLVFPGETDVERCRALKDIVILAHNLGFQIGIHATGDKSISACIDSFAAAEKNNPLGLRHYIIHGDLTSVAEAEKMAQYSIGLSVQPALAAAFAPFMRFSLSAAKIEGSLPLKSLSGYGVHIAGGSDSPVISPDWRDGVQSAILRETTQKQVFGRDQKIELSDAIRMYTNNGAWQDHMEGVKGSIEPGKLADFCILGEDISKVEPHRIKEIPVLMTVIGGKIVYDAG